MMYEIGYHTVFDKDGDDLVFYPPFLIYLVNESGGRCGKLITQAGDKPLKISSSRLFHPMKEKNGE